ncbi:hypothetical protein [Pleionea sediminis]|uniref:hypothetical protein n=1 Tax=Pleionea sediminis TaxID=2569479 RepID=UPI001184EDD1|nr:hypothetical protein [Pleionea sediminis]
MSSNGKRILDIPGMSNEVSISEKEAVTSAPVRSELELLKEKFESELALAKKKAFDEGYSSGIEEGKKLGVEEFLANNELEESNVISSYQEKSSALTEAISQLTEYSSSLKTTIETISQSSDERAIAIVSRIIKDLYLEKVYSEEALKTMVEGVGKDFGLEGSSVVLCGKGVIEKVDDTSKLFQLDSRLGEFDIEIKTEHQSFLINYEKYLKELVRILGG